MRRIDLIVSLVRTLWRGHDRLWRCLPQAFLVGMIAVCSHSAIAQESVPKDSAENIQDHMTAQPQQSMSEAERVASLRHLIRLDEGRLSDLNREGVAIRRRFEAVSETFSNLDLQLNEARTALDEAHRTNDNAAASRLEGAISNLDRKWNDARSELDLVIQRRKLIEQQLSTLPEKIELEQQGLDFLLGVDPHSRTPPFAHPPAQEGRKGTAELTPKYTETDDRQGVEPAPYATYDPIVAEAHAAYQSSQRALQLLKGHLARIDRGIVLFGADLENTEQLMQVAETSLAEAQQVYDAARAELRGLEASGGPRGAIRSAAQALEAAKQRLAEAHDSVERHKERVESVGIPMEQIRAAREQRLAELRAAETRVAEAQAQLSFVESPFAPHRISRWLRERGFRVLALVVFVIFLWLAARFVGSRIVMSLVLRSSQGTERERAERAETLRRAFQSAAGIVILVLGVLSVLEQLGIDVTVLLGGAAVFGMAIAFAAQNLVRDYFYGFMILMESQYQVGNVIRIGETSGTVENITLRMTTLRDLAGIAHFIPHNQVAMVSNYTHGWSRAVFEISVAYKEKIDRVMDVVMRVASELKQDSDFAGLLLDEPQMLGVDALAESAVVIKFMVKTQPSSQWAVKRQMLRRIKNEFDALGIEIPFPHRTVFHRDLDAIHARLDGADSPGAG